MLLLVASNVKFDLACTAFDEKRGIQDNEHLTDLFKSKYLHNERHDDRHV